MEKKIRITVVCAVVIQCLLLLCGQAPGMETAYTVQVMLCKNRDNALEYLEHLKQKGIAAQITEGKDRKGLSFYRIQVGRFPAQEAAARHAAALTAQGLDCWVTEAPGSAAPGPETSQHPEGTDNTTQPSPTTERAVPAAPSPQPLPTGSSPAPAAADNRTGAETVWPASTTRAYKYFNPEDGALHVTNSLHKIPERLRERIREIAVYPVKCLSLNSRDMVLLLVIDGAQKKVRLAEITPAEQQIPPACLKRFEAFLRSEPLRIKYDPGSAGPDGALRATLYLRTGVSLGLEMVRQGIALHNPEGISALQVKQFAEAESSARQKKACIWSAP